MRGLSRLTILWISNIHKVDILFLEIASFPKKWRGETFYSELPSYANLTELNSPHIKGPFFIEQIYFLAYLNGYFLRDKVKQSQNPPPTPTPYRLSTSIWPSRFQGLFFFLSCCIFPQSILALCFQHGPSHYQSEDSADCLNWGWMTFPSASLVLSQISC